MVQNDLINYLGRVLTRVAVIFHKHYLHMFFVGVGRLLLRDIIKKFSWRNNLNSPIIEKDIKISKFPDIINSYSQKNCYLSDILLLFY